MKIGTMEVIKGKKTTGYLPVGYCGDGAEIHIPLMSVCGVEDGPILWINAGVHGEELSGIFSIHKVMEMVDPETLKGTIIASPGCNPLALRGSNKFTVEDQLDMDQQFPGSPDGWLTQQMAYYFFEEVKKYASYMLDLHALGGMSAVPYTVFKSLPGIDEQVNVDARNMALCFGAKYNCYVDLSTATGELPGSVMGALDIQCALHNIPCIMAEMGSGNRILWENVELVKNGIMNCLKYFKMIEGEMETFHDQIVITKRKFPCTHKGGLILPVVPAGTIAKAGEVIAKVIDYVGNVLEEISYSEDVCIFAMAENPISSSGRIIAALGTEWTVIN